MLMFAIIAVFVAGLMVGRTPEYLGKKIESKEVKMAMLAILVLPFSILLFTAAAAVLPAGLAGLNNSGPHGFSEILYAFTSATANNGSAFAGLTANTMFYNPLLAVAMFVGRFLFIVPMMAVAGSLVAKKIVPPSAGTFPTDGPLFRRPGGGRHPDCGRSHILPVSGARSDRRTFRDAQRHVLLRLNP